MAVCGLFTDVVVRPFAACRALENGLSQTSLNGYARSLAGFGPCMFASTPNRVTDVTFDIANLL